MSPQPQYLEVPLARLTNQVLGELHQAGYSIYAQHVQYPGVLIFARLQKTEADSPALSQEQ